MAVDAVGTVLVDRFGARLVIEENRQVVRAPVGRGPYRLETAGLGRQSPSGGARSTRGAGGRGR